MLLPTLKEDPADADVISHKLMLRAGMIRQLASGLYTWLPLGLRVVRKIENIIREEMNRSGAQEVSMTVMSATFVWAQPMRRSSLIYFGVRYIAIDNCLSTFIRFKPSFAMSADPDSASCARGNSQ